MGLDVGDAARTALIAATDPLRERIPDARWVPPENLHLTLAFLGHLDDDRAAAFIQTLEAVAASIEPSAGGLAGSGAFPSARRAKVLWAGMEDDGGAAALAMASLDAADAAGIPVERRPFRSHITVARLRHPAPVDLGALDPQPARVPIDAVTVYASHLGGGRPPRYEVLRRIALGR